MNTETLKQWAEHMEELCSKNFPRKICNVSIHLINDEWMVRIESPQVTAKGDQITICLADARAQVDRLIEAQNNLAKTLGVVA